MKKHSKYGLKSKVDIAERGQFNWKKILMNLLKAELDKDIKKKRRGLKVQTISSNIYLGRDLRLDWKKVFER